MKVWKVALAMTAIAAIGLTACKKKDDSATSTDTATAPAATDNAAPAATTPAAPDNSATTAPAANAAPAGGDMKNAAAPKK